MKQMLVEAERCVFRTFTEICNLTFGKGHRTYDRICPYRFNPLEGAVLWGPLIDCSWHHFQFDRRTGVITFPPTFIRKICDI